MLGTSLALTPESIASTLPPELLDRQQWVAWRFELREGKRTKCPYSPITGRRAESTNPASWGSFTDATAYWQRAKLDGIGFVFHGDYAGVDLDHCRDAQTGVVNEWALKIVERLDSYTEISPSGTGLHIFVRGKLPGGRRRRGQIEAYDAGRYFTITGHHFEDSPWTINERQGALDDFHRDELADPEPAATAPPPKSQQSGQAAAPAPNQLSDTELLERMLGSAHGAEIRRLWEGEWASLGYPSQSEADLALCNHLAYWCDRRAGDMDRLFRQSKLFRPKWDVKKGAEKYGEKTIAAAIAGTASTYADDVQTSQVDVADLGYTEDELLTGTSGGSSTAGPGAVSAAVARAAAHRTDAGNAKRLVALHGRDIRWCGELGRWFVWDQTRWRVDDDGELVRRAKLTAGSIFREAAQENDPDEKKKLEAHAFQTEGIGRLLAMIELAKSEPGIAVRGDTLDANPWLLNCRNGTVDLRSGDLRPHQRQDLITKLAPVEFDLNATSTLWEGFLERILPDEDVRDFVQRAAGYSATGTVSERKLLVAYGTGRNGKSTMLETLQAALGDYALMTPSTTLLAGRDGAIPNDIARLKGARFVNANETEEGKHLAEAQVKQLTGGDMITARFLRQEFFDFKPQFTPWLRTNHKPVIRGTDKAIWDRIRLIPFTVRIPDDEVDPELQTKLLLELPAVLAWTVQGCLLWQLRSLNDAPEAVLVATAGYQNEMDILGDFLDECCTISPAAMVTQKELYKEYQKWCEDTGIKAMSHMRFSAQMEERGFVKGRTKVARLWHGLEVAAPNP